MTKTTIDSITCKNEHLAHCFFKDFPTGPKAHGRPHNLERLRSSNKTNKIKNLYMFLKHFITF
jgi:hypothetical protein